VATLICVFGDIDVAEDAVQEAFAVALRKWPTDGPPPNPGGWITTTARGCAIDPAPCHRANPGRRAEPGRRRRRDRRPGGGTCTPSHATRAGLLRRLGRPDEAADAYEKAASLAPTAVESDFLADQAQRRR
jgi:predicted RNA polymerase sigma factor